jgi:methyl-accepting chemotaxis protein
MNITRSSQMNKEQEYTNRFVNEIRRRSDKVVEIFLVGYFLFGIAVAPVYDTWAIALTIGPAILIMYFLSKKLFPGTTLNQYVASAGVGIFMGQFIYQMHGMFEMHFFAFIGSALMITYQNWKAQIPLTIVIVLHHAIFGYIQYKSFAANAENTIFFSQLEFMDLQTFIIHCFLAVVILLICCLWAYDLNKRTRDNVKNIVTIEEITNRLALNIEYASQLANGVYDDNHTVDENDPLGMILLQLNEKLVAR